LVCMRGVYPAVAGLFNARSGADHGPVHKYTEKYVLIFRIDLT